MRKFGVLAGRPSRCRWLVVSMAVAMVSSVGVVSSAQAAVPKVSRPVPAPSQASTVPLAWRGIADAASPSMANTMALRGVAAAASPSPAKSVPSGWRGVAAAASPAAAKTVPLASRGFAAAAAASRAVARAPQILLSPSTAIGAETVKVTGKLPKVTSRPVTVQRKIGKRWVTVVKARTSRTGSYAKSFRARGPGSYTIRTLAPRVKVSGKVRAQYVTPARTLKVVAQAAYLSMPATVTPGQAVTATLTFRPARVGRAVALQIWSSGTWATLAFGRQSAAGTAKLTVIAGGPGSYSLRALTGAAAGAAAFGSPLRTVKVAVAPDTTAPGPVTRLTATAVSTSAITLAWYNPAAADYNGVTIRRAVGPVAPATVGSGTAVTIGASPYVTWFTDTGLDLAVTYSYAVFAHDRSVNYAAAATGTAVTNGTIVSPSISGTVTDAGSRPLAGADVWASSPSLSADWFATTAANGTYTFGGLPAGNYEVCFRGPAATGGSSDSSGYLLECYDNQTMQGTPKPVTVVAGVSTTGINADLATGGAVSGKVTVAAGANPALAGVVVTAFSPSTGEMGFALTAANGSYGVKGLSAGTSYYVCFDASGTSGAPGSSGATGGLSDATGYVQRCWPAAFPSMPTPVTVTLGATQGGIDVAMAPGGAISGKVTDAGGVHHGLGMVEVMVCSDSLEACWYLTTAVDGSYLLTGLPAATDYSVEFLGASATGGSSDVTGYGEQLPLKGVRVALEITTSGINTALGPQAP